MNKHIKNSLVMAIAVSMVAATMFTGCSSPFGISDKEKAKYYQSKDLLDASKIDYGNTFDKVVYAYFNLNIDFDKYIKELESYKDEGILTESLYTEFVEYGEYLNSMVGDTYVYYTTNGNPKTYMENDMSNVFTMIEQLERGWIGHWMYAIPDDDMQNVMEAYASNNLLLNFDDGTYQIVDYNTDVYGNTSGKNDMTRKLDQTVNPDATGIIEGDDGVDEEYQEYMDEKAEEQSNMYEIVSKNAFANYIVYRVEEPKNHTQNNFTAVIEDGKVVSIDGNFS